MDYDGRMEFSSTEVEKKTTFTVNHSGSEWLRCASKHTGIPQWLLACLIVTTIISAVWLCLSSDKPTNDLSDKITLIDPDTSGKVMVYLTPEPFLHKNPPPKYSEVVNTDDLNLEV